MLHVAFQSFLGKTPHWYKLTIIAFLLINPVVFFFISPFLAGWLLLLEFIFILAMALQCYPVPSGGLLAIEAIIIGLTTPAGVYQEVSGNLPIILLLIFMVTGIYYIKDVLFFGFTKLFISIRNKAFLSFMFCLISATLSSFLDALTLMAVIVAVCFNLYAIYHRVASSLAKSGEVDAEMKEFKGFLRNIVMHGAVGTALGGTMTMVGEPQNLMIATKLDWSFVEFFLRCSVISLPVAAVGLITCPILEMIKFPGFGYQLPAKARDAILKDYREKYGRISKQNAYLYLTQLVVGVLLFVALALHVAEIGLIGIGLIVVLTALRGLTHEHNFAEAFNNAMPFVTLIMVFFAILAVVHDQHLVTPVIEMVFEFKEEQQLIALYLVNGVLSLISDNVFIASVFINELEKAFAQGMFSREWYDKLAVIVNMGTNIPAVATPNGQAAFLFLLTSSLAPVIRLSYLEMVKLALPYTIILTATGGVCVYLFF